MTKKKSASKKAEQKDAAASEKARTQAIAEIDQRLAGNGKAKAAKATKPPKAHKEKRLSALDAAAKVLASAKEPMRAPELIDAMAKQNLWKSPGGKTPGATLYAAMIREISKRGKDARFKKTDRGLFAATKGA